MEGSIRRLITPQTVDPARGSFMPNAKPVTGQGVSRMFLGRRVYMSDEKHPYGFRFILMDDA